eukprot:m.200979 g.200979  ORF g.200979 m.200979 type:complete len:306 (-) comp21280_c0_seq1:308-1225(-)
MSQPSAAPADNSSTSTTATPDMGGRTSRAARGVAALHTLQADPDSLNESSVDRAAGGDVASRSSRGKSPLKCPFSGGKVPLNVIGRTHHTSAATEGLLEAIGGVAKLRQVTDAFYDKMFQDPHLDQFVRSHDDPHAERLATWIAEKMGDPDQPWTAERQTRPHHVVEVAGGMRVTVHDRSSAHFAAWNSPKRHPSVVGEHFNLQDARVWMRLMFWSAREVGAFDGEAGKAFEDWYLRFIGHFVRVYEGLAPPFARESARWSLNPENTRRYLENGRQMPDVHAQSTREAYASLPAEERHSAWPYDN